MTANITRSTRPILFGKALFHRALFRTMSALSLGLALSACGNIPTNRMLESVHQPVVQRNSYVFDVATLPGGGLSLSEQRRLAGWFEAMALRYGDKIAIDDPTDSTATRQSVEAIAARYGMLVGETTQVTAGEVLAGTARIVINRTVAEVPGCPDWSASSDFNPANATSSGYGCAVNSNMAAMVADKEHLVRGANGTGKTVTMSSTKAIDSYRDAKPTGENGLKASATGGGGK